MKIQILWLGMLLTYPSAGQTFRETITQELTFEKKSAENALIIANLNGGVTIQGYAGDKILIEAVRNIDAKTEERLSVGKEEVKMAIIDRADTLIVYVQDGCHRFTRNKSRRKHSGFNDTGWGYQSLEEGRDCHLRYDYKVDFLVKVPSTLNVVAGTINEGDVVVENVSGAVKARNINGSIRMTQLRSEAEASTINGDVDVEYASNPKAACRFYTLNGDINAMFKPGLAANLSFESFNGEFFTNIARLERLPAKVEKTDRGDAIRYKIEGNQFKVGDGGALLDFETFNGNVYLKELKN